jgi:hypothetical protein
VETRADLTSVFESGAQLIQALSPIQHGLLELVRARIPGHSAGVLAGGQPRVGGSFDERVGQWLQLSIQARSARFGEYVAGKAL